MLKITDMLAGAINMEENPNATVLVEFQGVPVVLGRRQIIELLEIKAAWLSGQLEKRPEPSPSPPQKAARRNTRGLQRISLMVRQAFDGYTGTGRVLAEHAGRLNEMLAAFDGHIPARPTSQLGYMLEMLVTLQYEQPNLKKPVEAFLKKYPVLTDETIIPRKFAVDDDSGDLRDNGQEAG
jgi:hypothetical protein